MKKLKLLIFAHDASLYGATLSLLTLLEYLINDKRFDILVLLPYKGKMEERLSNLKIHFQIINYPHCIVRNDKVNPKERFKAILDYYKKNMRVRSKITLLIKKFKPDLIYSNTSIISAGFQFARKFKIPHVWHIREYGIEDFKYTYLPFRSYHRRLIQRTYKVIFISEALRKYWVNSKSSKYSVVYNGIVNRKKAMPMAKRIELNKKIIFGIVGAILPGKGQDIAIKAFAQVVKINPNCSLSIYGDAADKNYYERILLLIKELGCENNVHIFPFTDNQIIYSNLTVLLSCSRMEGLGRTIIEAMGCAIPVIANASGGPLELIENGKSGLLYQNSVSDLAANMTNLISNDHLYTHISQNGIERAYHLFDIENYTKSITNLFIETISAIDKTQ